MKVKISLRKLIRLDRKIAQLNWEIQQNKEQFEEHDETFKTYQTNINKERAELKAMVGQLEEQLEKIKVVGHTIAGEPVSGLQPSPYSGDVKPCCAELEKKLAEANKKSSVLAEDKYRLWFRIQARNSRAESFVPDILDDVNLECIECSRLVGGQKAYTHAGSRFVLCVGCAKLLWKTGVKNVE